MAGSIEVDDVIKKGIHPYAMYMPTKAVVADHSVAYSNDHLLIVAATTQDIDITLPSLASLAGEPYKILELIPVVANGYRVRIKCAGADTFPFGNTYFDLPASQKQFGIGLHPHGFNLRRNITVGGTYVRSNSWNATNFSIPTVLPFETEIENNQPEIIQWDSSGRITVQTAAKYDIIGGFSIGSTGGSTWNAQIELRKNGVYVDYSRVVTGNYGGEDDSIFGFMDVDMAVGDYLELWIDQTNLTGTLLTSKASIKTRL